MDSNEAIRRPRLTASLLDLAIMQIWHIFESLLKYNIMLITYEFAFRAKIL